jgi:uncharacterized protein (TIGR01440 family)
MSVLSELTPTEAVIAQLKSEAYSAALEILSISHLAPGSLFVVGCSSSEVGGSRIGTAASPSLARGLFEGIFQAVSEAQVYLCAQCCEHLNRALILEAKAAQRYGYEVVNVVPTPQAGGAFATAVYHAFQHPVAVEHIRAHAGMDIGDTFIGMHLRDVAVPFRISIQQIGDAHLTCARTRPKFIGGSRASYDETLID